MAKKSVFHETSPLLALLEQRYRSEGLGVAKPYHAPGLIDEAAVRRHAEANKADPFAAKRMRHYLAQGYILPSEVR
jgi:hypothetical protein